MIVITAIIATTVMIVIIAVVAVVVKTVVIGRSQRRYAIFFDVGKKVEEEGGKMWGTNECHNIYAGGLKPTRSLADVTERTSQK